MRQLVKCIAFCNASDGLLSSDSLLWTEDRQSLLISDHMTFAATTSSTQAGIHLLVTDSNTLSIMHA